MNGTPHRNIPDGTPEAIKEALDVADSADAQNFIGNALIKIGQDKCSLAQGMKTGGGPGSEFGGTIGQSIGGIRERRQTDHFNMPAFGTKGGSKEGGKSGDGSGKGGNGDGKSGDGSGKGGDGEPKFVQPAREASKKRGRTPRKAVRGTNGNTENDESDNETAHVRQFVPSEGSDWSKIGGMQEHIERVRENVIAPLLNPDIFRHMSSNLGRSKGILFHGPPGTGKTLMARGLVGECKKFDLNVTFYARKSADILSKYIGEGEKHLRELFEVAKESSPSVIFFDEIDGLAPVRTSSNDQAHSSIVSTLLAIMDGMDDRGTVIVIGATNRPDSLDPALRRPGRFDFELEFKPPDVNAREDILRIHAPKSMPPRFYSRIAQRTAGFTGADLEQLGSEAAMIAIRRNFPEMHMQGKEHLLKFADPNRGPPTEADFELAMTRVNSSSSRHTPNSATALRAELKPLFQANITYARTVIKAACPQLFELRSRKSLTEVPTDRHCWQHPHVCLMGNGDHVTKYVAPEILHQLDHLPVFVLDLQAMASDRSHGDPKSFIANAFREANRRAPSVVYVPNIDRWHASAETAVCHTFVQCVQNLSSNNPVCLMSTIDSEMDVDDLVDIENVMNCARMVRLQTPGMEQRRAFLSTLLHARSENYVEVRLRNECMRVQEKSSVEKALKLQHEYERLKAAADARKEEEEEEAQLKLDEAALKSKGAAAQVKIMDLKGDLPLDTGLQKEVLGKIKELAGGLLKSKAPLDKLKGDFQQVYQQAQGDNFHTLYEFQTAVEQLPQKSKEYRGYHRKATHDTHVRVNALRNEQFGKMHLALRQNEYNRFKNKVRYAANDLWFTKPLIAMACACVHEPDQTQALPPLAFSAMLRDIYSDINKLSNNLGEVFKQVSKKNSKVKGWTKQLDVATGGLLTYSQFCILEKKDIFDDHICNQLIKLAPTLPKLVSQAILDIKIQLGLEDERALSRTTTPMVSAANPATSSGASSSTDVLQAPEPRDVSVRLPPSIENACDLIVTMLVDCAKKQDLRDAFRKASIVESAFNSPECADAGLMLSGVVTKFISQQGDVPEFCDLAELWNDFSLSSPTDQQLANVFNRLAVGIAQMLEPPPLDAPMGVKSEPPKILTDATKIMEVINQKSLHRFIY